MPASSPSSEPERLRALASYEVLDTPPEPEFDQLTAFAAELFQVPIAMVSLVDDDRIWHKSVYGPGLKETPRAGAFCASTILGNGPLIVPDAAADERFAASLLVAGASQIRFYAGAPLTTHDGLRIGALCLMDTVPRDFSAAESASLLRMAALAMAAIEARLTERRLRQEMAVNEQTTRALRRVEARYQRIAEHTPGMVYQFIRRADGSAEFPVVSDACRDILGLEPAVLYRDANEYLKLVHPEDEPARQRAVAEALATKKPVRWEGRHILASGQIKWLQTSTQVQSAPNGDLFWDGVILDVTERRQADDRLRMLESSVETSNDAIVITEALPLDEPGPRILYVNQAFTRMTGYTEAEVLGKTPRMFQGPNTDPAVKRAIRQALERWEPVLVEMINYRRNGSEFWVELNIVPVCDRRGRWTHWVSVQRDITARREELHALQQARDEANRANAAKSEFLSRMSHELRTPLNAILGFGQLLEMSDPTPGQQQSISHVLSGGRHLLDLINEVLDISRIEAGNLELTLEAVHVASALEEIAALLRPLAARRNITLQVGRAERALDGALVQVDRQRLKQVLLNLLSNAIKYNHPAGRVDLACERAEDERRLRLSVRDTGPGIGAADLEKLFSPFERLNAKDSEVEGTGIGLAISKRLVEAMGGTIEVKSTVGEGSTFSLELPLAGNRLPATDGPDSQGAGRPPAAVAEPAKQRVLYIEDNVSNVMLIEAVLAGHSVYELLSAMDGRSGLEMAQAHHPDLILLDVHLPDLLGDAVLRALKEDERTRSIPVVMVSADATPTRVQCLLGLGATAYLTKPFNIAAFLRTLDEALVPKP